MRVLLIGDVIGKPGREALSKRLGQLRTLKEIDLVIANGENSAHGFGMTSKTIQEMHQAGVDVITSGNHVWDQREMLTYLREDVPVIRPLNLPPSSPGRGWYIVQKDNQPFALVINVIGNVYMGYDAPWTALDNLLDQLKPTIPVIVDFHAEASAEKMGMGWFLTGRVSAVFGTHTHVPTADARILPGGTAYVTDVGMTGPYNSIIGMKTEEALQRMVTRIPAKWEIATGPTILNAIIVEIDNQTCRARSIERYQEIIATDA